MYTDSDLGDMSLIVKSGFTCLIGADNMIQWLTEYNQVEKSVPFYNLYWFSNDFKADI